MKILLLIIFFIFVNYSLEAQSLSVFGIDTTGFPLIKAKFNAYDGSGNRIINLTSSDIEVKEDGLLRNVTYVSCPIDNTPIPISSVLTIDISGSMSGSGIGYAKEAAKAWVQAMPLGQSECAITSFNSNNFFNLDFTTNRNRLLNRIEELTTSDGTDFNAAFINVMSGGLLAAEKGRYKRIMILLTDGFATGNESAIILKAQQIGATVFCISISKECPVLLRNIAIKTNGLWFENIKSEEQARNVYLQILNIVQGNNPCDIEWESESNCLSSIVTAKITLLQNGTSSINSYYLPENAISKLIFKPPSLRFVNAVPGIKKDSVITITALNDDFIINNIKCSDPAFKISPVSFNLDNGQTQNLTVSLTATDSGYVFTKFDVENNICNTKYYVSGGYPGIKASIKTLNLLQPNGREVFVAGMDTTITWEGVLPDETVKIEYTTNNGNDWITISNKAKGLRYNWQVPNTPGNKCLARVTAKSSHMESNNEMILILAGSYDMGNTGGLTLYLNEKPVHRVNISREFLMGKFEVSQKLYESVTGKNPSSWKSDYLPVESVSWFDAIEFCNKLSILDGFDTCYIGSGQSYDCDWNAKGYRLPTEAEWEYACKAGTVWDYYKGELTSLKCSPGDIVLNDLGWYCGNSGDQTNEIGLKETNVFSLNDMIGNVSEWCWDWYESSYKSGIQTDPTGPSIGTFRVFRGGSWNDFPQNCRSAARGSISPTLRITQVGFRICRTL